MVIGGVAFLIFGRMRSVQIDGDALLVSDFTREERVPLTRVEGVEEHQHRGRVSYISVTLDGSPASDGRSQLRDLVESAHKCSVS